MCLNGSSVTRESSTLSLKSETISVSCTPPNITDNRSLIAELAGSQPTRSENIRLTQSLNFSTSPTGGNHPSIEPPSYNDGSHLQGNSYSHEHNAKTRAPSSYNLSGQAHLPRSWSEDNSGVSPPSSSFLPSSGPWSLDVPSRHPHCIDNDAAPPQSAVSSHSHHANTTSAGNTGTYTVNHRSDRMVSTSLTSQPSLTGYSGNQPSAARVASIPQHSVFGDDKYVINTTMIEAKTATTRYPLGHENQPSVSTTVSRGSQYDGAMDDLSEMKDAVPTTASKEPTKHVKTSSAGYSGGTPRTHTTKLSVTNSAAATPPASPSKSSSTSPKKVQPPARQRMQQFRDKMGGLIDCGTHCASGERSSEPASRTESPDPQKMSPEEKKRWKVGWRTKLHSAKVREDAEVRKWKREKSQGGGQEQ
jgi:hypothetical protein